MAIVSGISRSCSGLIGPGISKLRFGIQRCNNIRLKDYSTFHPASERLLKGRIQHRPAQHSGLRNKHVLNAGQDHYPLSYEEDLPQEPFWPSLVKEAIWAWKSLFSFLFEQPSQLKYIEWPSFQSTLKTATLTLVLVAIFIVVLSSVDSALCFMLALLLRRTP